MASNGLAGHGINAGNGYLKQVVIGPDGKPLPPVVMPAMVAPAGKAVVGQLHKVPEVKIGGAAWWVGEDAQLSTSAETNVSMDRLGDATFIPALILGALQRLGPLNGAGGGVCVTGLPATWATDRSKQIMLGQRIRAAVGEEYFSAIKVIPEPLGAIWGELLDDDGEPTGAADLQKQRVGIVDLGHNTLDLAIVDKMTPLASSLMTFPLGSIGPLGQIRAAISSRYNRNLTMYEVDQAVRSGTVRIAGEDRPLHKDWDAPLRQNGRDIVSKLVESWREGYDLDAILIAGGGAELAPIVEAIRARFRQARPVTDGQLAIARGYARLARRLARAAK
ncbi:MAG TPA: ParM/StbA family protein [Herpetosiphonaceae bacterium]